MLNAKAAKHSLLSPVAAALWAALCTSWVRFAQRSGYNNCCAKTLFSLFEFAHQLLLQMSSRRLFDRATLVRHPLLLRLSFAPRSRFHRLGHVPDLGPARADVSLFWFCVRIHELARLICYEDNRNRSQLKNYGKSCYGQNRFIVTQSHRRPAQEPCHAESRIP